MILLANQTNGTPRSRFVKTFSTHQAREPLHRCLISQRSRRRRNISSFSIKIKPKTTRNSVSSVVDLVSGGRFPASRDQINKLKLYNSGVLFPENAEKQQRLLVAAISSSCTEVL